ncbi:hypothetical protein SLEP1_g54708 [Rubroshorea leprosula]|uniref:Uncharacterized protein n=1 Tax=Rubroshorea leprosula TaxID=152421 RepID=A0AAV5MFD4_9ROSI|nr:hypothetical protein SLEP1_g54708 [Rubroshorea leprosula]
MQLHPRHIGRNHRENLVSKLIKDVEGTCRRVITVHKYAPDSERFLLKTVYTRYFIPDTVYSPPQAGA